ncbi:MAG: CDP-glycerol glycerophosphotransferase family protein [Candidatus Delongbacteria bacterium]|nr:CDP-glycerol glycerophosphotransferase family protein [Candidatus Delongbacteria bacterium]
MKKIKLLFKLGYVYHKAAFDPVIDVFMKDPQYDIYFSMQEERIRRFFINFNYRSPLIDEWIRQGYRFTEEKKGFDVIIVGDTVRDAEEYGDPMLCFLNHGTGIKTILYRNLARFPNHRYYLFVEGRYREEQLHKSGVLGKSRIEVIGLPKLDYYFQGRYADREGILKKWGLDPAKPTVLFAPTYKPTCMYQIQDEIFEATRDYNLIIKLHHYSWMGKYAPHKQHRIFERRVRRYPHSVLLPVTEYNIVPYMAVADTLISEASSTVFDFLAFDKIGIIYDLQCDNLKHSDGQPILEVDNRQFLKDAFIHIQAPQELKAAIDRAVHPTEDMKAKAAEYKNHYFHQLDGRASQRMKTRIEEILAQRNFSNGN